jgi:DNA invertase Pin-like site-specific DNA recombinase
MTAVIQWEREAIGERTRDSMSHKRTNGERVGNIQFGYRLCADRKHVERDPAEQAVLDEIRCFRKRRCYSARNRRRLESPRAPNPARFRLAARARGANHQAGGPLSAKSSRALKTATAS